jgi:hypothetical protein
VTAQAHILRVFIASPGDVSEERDVVVAVCRELTHEVGRHHGWVVQADGWELTRPGLGRAQDRINRQVDVCDVLVGVLNKRWGTVTGEFTSGFEEELLRVRDRREAGQPVDALLYLRHLDDDEGIEALNREFRESVKRWALYQQYDKLDEFRRAIKGHLNDVLNERVSAALAQRPSAEPQGALEPAETAAALPQSSGGRDVEDSPAERDARLALGQFAGGLQPGADPPDAPTITRAYLTAAAHMSASITGSVMNISDLIRVYDAREQLDLTVAERRYVARTMVSGRSSAPGWGLIGPDPDIMEIARIAVVDSRAQAQAGAIRELGAAGLARTVEGRDVTLETLLAFVADSDEVDVIAALCEVLEENPIPESALLLAILADEDRPSSYRARRSLLRLLAGEEPDAAAKLYADSDRAAPDELPDALVAGADRISDHALRGLRSGRPKARVLRLRILAASGRLSSDDVGAGLGDKELVVRIAAAQAALAAGHRLDEGQLEGILEGEELVLLPDDLCRAWVATVDSAELRSRAVWGELQRKGPIPLRELLRRGDPDALAAARTDLAGDLAERRAEGIEARVARLLATDSAPTPDPVAKEAAIREIYVKMAERYQTMHDDHWRSALLDGLAQHPEAGDRELALRYLDSSSIEVGNAAATLLRRVGQTADSDAMVAYAMSMGADATEAFRWLAATTTDSGDLLERARAQGLEPIAQAHLVDALTEAGHGLDPDTLDALLRHERSELRMAALRMVVADGSRATAGAWLDRVLRGGYRYFDVVAILDRLTYAPDVIADRRRRELEGTGRLVKPTLAARLLSATA